MSVQMKEKIREIYTKYGDFVFNCAVPHLMDLGARTLKQMDVEAQCQKLITTTPDCAIVSGDMQADILRCSAELAQLKMNDILRFVQTDMQFYGTKIHPGRVISFVKKKTGARILSAVLPADTTDEQIMQIFNRVDANRHEFHRFEPRTIAEKCLQETGVIWDYLYADDEIPI